MDRWAANASRLRQRIKAGLAEPISERERAQLEELRDVYVRRFGRQPDGRNMTKIVEGKQHGTAA
jgi:2-oxo-4-hydroxy-4-carboxy--5-ureidoimidazoline (OHCU) decarboxylase